MSVPIEGSSAGSEVPSESQEQRRCSARLLSQSVQQTLRQLKRREHNARVAELLRRNTIFYQRQRVCETVFTTSVLVSFTIFSIYMVLSYGFEYFCTPNFKLVTPSTSQTRRVDSPVTLMCSTDHPWEWCRWVHMDRYCDWEWKGEEEGTVVTGCTMEGVEMVGNYSDNQCGLRIGKLRPTDRGVWLCEMEKYHLGFGRRYGEVVYGQTSLGVVRSKNKTTSPATTTIQTTTRMSHSTEAVTASQEELDLVAEQEEEERKYQRNFLILRVVVRTCVALTLLCLSSMFVALFLHNWRQWEVNIREKAEQIANRESEEDDDEDYCYEEIDPMLKKKLLQTRRKSVAFSVCVMDKDNMTFDLDRKKVLLGMSSDRLPNLPSLAEQAETETTENVKFNVPLLQGRRNSRSRQQSYHQRTGRRMSVPAVPLGGLSIQEVSFGTSIETII